MTLIDAIPTKAGLDNFTLFPLVLHDVPLDLALRNIFALDSELTRTLDRFFDQRAFFYFCVRPPILRSLPAQLCLHSLALNKMLHRQLASLFRDSLVESFKLGGHFLIIIRLEVIDLHDQHSWTILAFFIPHIVRLDILR